MISAITLTRVFPSGSLCAVVDKVTEDCLESRYYQIEKLTIDHWALDALPIQEVKVQT